MIEYRPYLVPDRRFDLRSHRYLEDIYRTEAQSIVLCKSSQMGISEYLISYAMHACDMRGATVLYVFPTDSHVSDFSAARMGPAIEASEYLQSIIVDALGKDGKRGSDKVTLKRIRNRFMYFRGGHVKPDGASPGLKSIDADITILDELDECDHRVLGIAEKRLGHSPLKEKRLVSTPTYPGVGIHAEYLLSDQRQWFIPCPHCNHRQNVTIDNVVTEWKDKTKRPAAWHQQDGKAYAACLKCHKPLDLLADGEWVAAYPGRPVVGFHVTKFAGATLDLDAIIEGLQSYNATRNRETWNQDLGLPYVAEGGQLTDTHLDTLRRDYSHGTSPKRCYMGIDVGSVLHCVIREEPDSETGERRQLFAGELSWDEAARVIKQYNPVAVVIDGLPETKAARDLQAAFPSGKVWLCYYSGVEQKEDYAIWKRTEGAVNADRTRSLDEMYSRVYEGKNTLPGNARDIARYYEQMKAPVRLLEKNARGIETARYVESGADHYAHAETYCAIASLRKVTTGGKAGQLDY